MEGPASAGPITNLKFKLLVNYKQTKMKKVIAIFAIATTLVACGGNASTEATATDSTAVDSTVVAVDSAAVVADTTAVAPAEVK